MQAKKGIFAREVIVGFDPFVFCGFRPIYHGFRPYFLWLFTTVVYCGFRPVLFWVSTSLILGFDLFSFGFRPV